MTLDTVAGGSSVLSTLLGSFGLIATGVLGFLGVRFASRQTKAAAAAQRELDGEKLDLDKIKALWTRLSELETEVRKLTAREIAQHDALLAHVPWDYMVAERLRALIDLLSSHENITVPTRLRDPIPEAPPLTPPRAGDN